MKIGVPQARAARAGATLCAVLLAPVLLVAGGPLRNCLLRYLNRPDGPGMVDKERGWVHPAYYFVLNGLVDVLSWPSARVWEALRH